MRNFSQVMVDSFIGEITYEGATKMDDLYMGYAPEDLLSIADVVRVLADNGYSIDGSTLRRRIYDEKVEAKKYANVWLIYAHQLPLIAESIRGKGRPPKDED